MYEYRAHPIAVVDGDTIDLDVDLGFHITIRDRFRLLGINTPERGQPGFAEAKYFVADRIMHLQWITARTRLDKTDKYGRMLADIWYSVGGIDPAQQRNLNTELLAAGLAVPYMTQG